MKKHTLLVIILFLLYIPLSVFAQTTDNSDTKEVTILHWNDFHARNMPYKVNKKNEKEPVYVGGVSSLLGYLRLNRDNKSLVLHGGDEYQGTPISTISKGFSQVGLLNLFNLDGFVLGNHDFDYGQYTLDSALRGANYDYLAANISRKNNSGTYAKPYIVKIVNGVKIGIIGVVPMDLFTLTLPRNVSDIKMLNTDSVITADMKQLKSEKCNLIILLSHNGADVDSVFAVKFHKDLDIIIGGHSHTPIFRPRVVDGVLICQAGSYGRWLGRLDVKVDTKKDTVVGFSGKLIETLWDSAVYDKPAQEMVENMLASIEPEMKRPIGILLDNWNRRSIGQWQADITRERVNSDIAFMNDGGVRKDMIKGDITVGDIWEINPFGNTIVKFEVSGKTLKEMIMNAIIIEEKKGRDNYEPALVSGVDVLFDSKKIKEGKTDFLVSFKVGGKDIDLNKRYTIATNNYLGTQIKKFFGEIEEEIKVEDTNIIDRDMIIEAIEKQKEINPVFERRIKDIN